MRLKDNKTIFFIFLQWPRLPMWIYPCYKLLLAAVLVTLVVLTGVIPNRDWYNQESDRIKWFIYITNHQIFFVTLCLCYQAVITMFVTCCYKYGIRGRLTQSYIRNKLMVLFVFILKSSFKYLCMFQMACTLVRYHGT